MAASSSSPLTQIASNRRATLAAASQRYAPAKAAKGSVVFTVAQRQHGETQALELWHLCHLFPGEGARGIRRLARAIGACDHQQGARLGEIERRQASQRRRTRTKEPLPASVALNQAMRSAAPVGSQRPPRDLAARLGPGPEREPKTMSRALTCARITQTPYFNGCGKTARQPQAAGGTRFMRPGTALGVVTGRLKAGETGT